MRIKRIISWLLLPLIMLLITIFPEIDEPE